MQSNSAEYEINFDTGQQKKRQFKILFGLQLLNGNLHYLRQFICIENLYYLIQATYEEQIDFQLSFIYFLFLRALLINTVVAE